MLPKRFRFRGSSGIVQVKKSGASWQGRHFVVRHTHDSESCSRFAVVVSLKISRKATTRNKVKRRLYEIIRLFIKDNPEFGEGIDCIFYVRSAILSSDFDSLRTEVHHFFRSLAFIKS